SLKMCSMAILPVTVFAATNDRHTTTVPPLKQDDLSLYSVPQQKLRYEEPEAGQLEESVATLRKLVEPYAAWWQDTYSRVKPKIQGVVQLSSDTYAFLKNPPKDLYPRVGIIGFTGILGLFLARGSRIKRIVYPAGLMALSASLYFPEKTAALVKSTGESVYDCAVQSYSVVEKMLMSNFLKNKKRQLKKKLKSCIL
uniref:MICOS complex subunit n=1 Tax=Gouania willdenowi TaxID=441366 RepID=A0A8C5E6U1_GOUWI